MEEGEVESGGGGNRREARLQLGFLVTVHVGIHTEPPRADILALKTCTVAEWVSGSRSL